jgi:HEAT repeat protein
MTVSILGVLFGKESQDTASDGVTFLRQEKRPPMQGVSVLATYRYYKALSTDAALEFRKLRAFGQHHSRWGMLLWFCIFGFVPVYFGQTDDVSTLISQLKAPDATTRDHAFAGLVKVGAPAVEPLISALRDPDERVRGLAAGALFTIGTPAVEPLIVALKETNVNVRVYAAVTLGSIKDSRAVEPLIAALKDTDPYVRGNEAVALGSIKDPRAVEPLIAALKDTDAWVRGKAAGALGSIKDPRAVEPLIAALKDTDAKVGGNAADALGAIGAPAVEPLVARLRDKDPSIQGFASMALSKIGTPAVEPLIGALKDSDDSVRWVAVKTLSQIGDPREVDPLIAMLKDPAADVESFAVAALAKIGAPAVGPLMVALWSEDRVTQRGAVVALSMVGTPAMDSLNAALVHKDDRASGQVEACIGGRKNVAEFFIANKANVNAKVSDGKTALMFASEAGYADIVRLLVASGAAVDAVGTSSGNLDVNLLTAPPLVIASANGQDSTVQALLDCGADINIRTADGRTALMWASSYGLLSTVQTLLARGADVNAIAEHVVPVAFIRFANGATAYEGNTYTDERFSALARSSPGAVFHPAGIEKDTALSLAISEGHADVSKALIKAAAK